MRIRWRRASVRAARPNLREFRTGGQVRRLASGSTDLRLIDWQLTADGGQDFGATS